MENDFKYQLLEIENKVIKNEIKEFKKFAFKGDMIKISIGIILGNSFNEVVKSISDNIIMPIVNFIISKTGNNWRNWDLEIIGGLNLEIGKFLGSSIDFLLTALFLYLIYMKIMKKFLDDNSISSKICTKCLKEDSNCYCNRDSNL